MVDCFWLMSALLTAAQVHQRGRRVSFYAFLGIMGSQLGPILGGYVTDKHGWRTQLWMLTAYWSATLLLLFFAVPETNYRRPLMYETDMAKGCGQTMAHTADEECPYPSAKDPTKETSFPNERAPYLQEKRSWLQELLPFQKIESNTSFFDAFARLLMAAFFPIVWYTFIVSSKKTTLVVIAANYCTDHCNLAGVVRGYKYHPRTDLWQRPDLVHPNLPRLHKCLWRRGSIVGHLLDASLLRSHMHMVSTPEQECSRTRISSFHDVSCNCGSSYRVRALRMGCW